MNERRGGEICCADFRTAIDNVKWGLKMMEIRWMNSNVLRLDGVDGLSARKKKKKVMVEKS